MIDALFPDPDLSPSCDGGDHDTCLHIANPAAHRLDRRSCMCTCHLPNF